MDNFVQFTNNRKTEILREAALKMKLSPEILEKDFWVCWTLKCLYSIPEIASHIIFKGGTSLSKAYGLIDRFSEDCDITINKKIFSSYKEPGEDDISGKEQARRVELMILFAQEFVKNIIRPFLNKEISTFLDKNSFKLEHDTEDQQTLLFYYPSCLSILSLIDDNQRQSYIRPAIKLEFGMRGSMLPKEDKIITPYVVDIFHSCSSKASA